MSEKKVLTVAYSENNPYSEEWEKAEYHCPQCGEQKVWGCDGIEDYHLGTPYLCTGCRILFYLPGGAYHPDKDFYGDNNQDIQRLAQLCEE